MIERAELAPLESLRPELRVLLECLRPGAPGTALSSLDRIDWPALVGAATLHRVVPALYRAMRRMPVGSVPESELEALKRKYFANAGRNLHLARELAVICALLRREGIEAIAFKGPTLARQAYGELTRRQWKRKTPAG